MKFKIAILGSTGSIGKSLLKVISKNKYKSKITLLTSNTNYQLLLKQAINFKVNNVIITDPKKLLIFQEIFLKKRLSL